MLVEAGSSEIQVEAGSSEKQVEAGSGELRVEAGRLAVTVRSPLTRTQICDLRPGKMSSSRRFGGGVLLSAA